MAVINKLIKPEAGENNPRAENGSKNIFEDWKVPHGEKGFDRILSGYEFISVLEIGSGSGMNLRFIHGATRGRAKFYALEPDEQAFDMLTTQELGFRVEHAFNCDASKIPLPDNSVELVFTAGELATIHPDKRLQSMGEIVRVSKRYVLCIENFALLASGNGNKQPLHQDFGKMYLDNFPELEWMDYGFLWEQEFPVFDNLSWWIFKKNGDYTCS